MSKIFVEGGGQGKDLHSRCREAFSKLIGKLDVKGRAPRIVASGTRRKAYDGFRTAFSTKASGKFVALLVDSEGPVADIEKPWEHLTAQDAWEQPPEATDENVMLMATSMETWISADRATLKAHYGSCLNEKKLPPLNAIENRDRHDVLQALTSATRDCTSSYAKGQCSFELVGKLEPQALRTHLPCFARFERLLRANL